MTTLKELDAELERWIAPSCEACGYACKMTSENTHKCTNPKCVLTELGIGEETK